MPITPHAPTELETAPGPGPALAPDTGDPGCPPAPPDRLIDLPEALASVFGRRIDARAPLARTLETVLEIDRLNAVYGRVAREVAAADAANAAALKAPGSAPAPAANFFEHALRAFRVRYTVSDADRAKIPARAPVVVVANHPFGGLDGLVLGGLLSGVRPDSRLLANHLVGRLGPLRDWVIPVNPFGGGAAAQANRSGLRDVLAHLKGGGLLATFPAGEVSRVDLRGREVVDPQWHANTARLVRATGATVVPIYFEGHNSLLFQAAGVLHPKLRTALLPHELLHPRDRTVRVKVGTPIPPARLAGFPSDRALTGYLRLRTYLLADRDRNRSRGRRRGSLAAAAPSGAALEATMEPVIAPVPEAAVAAELEALPAGQRLVEKGDFEVFYARSWQIPQTLREVGRLREITFRAAREGTGEACDLSRYDRYYVHLLLWDRRARQVVGGYRLGETDKILRHLGPRGLYNSRFFDFDPQFFASLGPALEMGRSFIRPEYQRKAATLPLVWRGIGEFVVRHPRYRFLFGPVSTSHDYRRLSKDLILAHLRRASWDPRRAAWVTAHNPPHRPRLTPSRRRALAHLRDADDLSAAVAEIEPAGRGIPVLLKHYLKLGARAVAFNVDADFGHVLDTLVVVDLARAPGRTLKRYLGEGAEAFVQRHVGAS